MSHAWPRPLAAVWFDLDGTLVDSAPDLYHAVETLCAEQDVPTPGYAEFRPRVSRGGMAMLRGCFPGLDEAALAQLLPRFLELYSARLDRDTRLFQGMDEVLDGLDERGLVWGVVSNKVAALGAPLLGRLGLLERAVACVFGDTLPVKKPHPAPLQHACRQAGVAVAESVYVGDDERDIQAANAAGMCGVVAAWGYLDGSDPDGWGAHAVLDDVQQLRQRLSLP